MSRLLIDEYPLMVLPSLVRQLGWKEAMVLQQMHYWLDVSGHHKEGRKWIYNTYKQWHAQFPMFSERTLRRTIKSLEEKGYILSDSFNDMKMDQTKWYTLDYEKVDELKREGQTGQLNGQGGRQMRTPCPPQLDSVTTPIPETTPEITTERVLIPFSEIIDHLNQKTGSAYRATGKKTRMLIKARWDEGFRLEDMKKVIDLKTAEWLNDPKWRNFLRPETLFGTKFESYLNQKTGRRMWKEEEFYLDD